MLLTLKQLSECQDAIERVGSVPILPEFAALSYRMSKNVEKLKGNTNVRDYNREKMKLLRKFGTERKENPGFYQLAGAGQEQYNEVLDALEAETVEIRIRQIDFLKYLDAIKPMGQISPADINALEFIFTFPVEFDDEDDKPATKETGKKEKV